MSPQKNKTNTYKRLWQRTKSTISPGTIFSTSVAILGLILSLQANMKSEEANKIARDANAMSQESNRIARENNKLIEEANKQTLPNIKIFYVGEGFPNQDQAKYPCLDKSGAVSWNKDLLVYLDIENGGGRAIALRLLPKPEGIDTSTDIIRVKVAFMPFYSLEEFDKWMNNIGRNPLEFPFREQARLILPLNIPAGETRKIVLLEQIEMRAESTISPQQLLTTTLQHDWTARPDFVFAGDTKFPGEIPISTPYTRSLIEEGNIPPFEVCQN